MKPRERKYFKDKICSSIFNQYFTGMKRVRIRSKYGDIMSKKEVAKMFHKLSSEPPGRTNGKDFFKLWNDSDVTGITAAEPGKSVTITIKKEDHERNRWMKNFSEN